MGHERHEIDLEQPDILRIFEDDPGQACASFSDG